MKILLAAVLALGLAACGHIQTSIEACIIDPEYGKICASYSAGKVTITTDVQIPQEVHDRIESYMKKLAGAK